MKTSILKAWLCSALVATTGLALAQQASISTNQVRNSSVAPGTSATEVLNNLYTSVQLGTPNRGMAVSANTAALPAYTYANGTAGVGATMTGTANGAVPTATMDNVAPVVGQRFWHRDHTGAGGSNIAYGLWQWTQLGTVSLPFIATRVTDADTGNELGYSVALTQSGTTLAGYVFRVSNDPNTTVTGTTAINVVAVTSGSGVAAEAAARIAADAAETARATAAEAALGAVTAQVTSTALAPSRSIVPTAYTTPSYGGAGRVIVSEDTVPENGYVESFSTLVPTTGTFQYRFAVGSLDGSNNFTPTCVTDLQTVTATSGNSFYRYSLTNPTQCPVRAAIDHVAAYVVSGNGIAFKTVTGKNYYLGAAATAPVVGTPLATTLTTGRQAVTTVEVRTMSLLPNGFAANTAGAFPRLNSRAMLGLGNAPEYLGALAVSPRVAGDAYLNAAGELVAAPGHSLDTYTIAGPTTGTLQSYTDSSIRIGWNIASPGFPRNGTLREVSITGPPTAVAGNLVRAWHVRFIDRSAGTVRKIAYIGEADASVANRVIRFQTALPVLAGDEIGIQFTLSGPSVAGSGNPGPTRMAVTKESTSHATIVTPVTDPNDEANPLILASASTPLNSGMVPYTATISVGSPLLNPNRPNGVVQLDASGQVPSALLPPSGASPLKGLKSVYLAKGDMQVVTDGTVTASTTLNIVSPLFAPTDVGKTLAIPYAGADNGTKAVGQTHVTTIAAYVSPTQVTLTAAPVKAIPGPRTVTDAAMTLDSAVLSSATANFSINDVGKKVTVPGAGYLIGSGGGSPLYSRIVGYVSATQVTLQHTARATVSAQTVSVPGAWVGWGTDDTVALQNAAAATPSLVSVEPGRYLTTAAITVHSNWKWVGVGRSIATISPVGSGFSAFFYNGGPDLTDVEFADFSIDGAGVRAATYSAGNKGIFLRPVQRFRVTGMGVYNTSATAIGCDFLRDYVIAQNDIDWPGSQVDEFGSGGGGSGVGIGTGRYTDENGYVYANSVRNAGKYGIFFESQSASLRSRGMVAFDNYVAYNLFGISDNGVEDFLAHNNVAEFNRTFDYTSSTSFVAGFYSRNVRYIGNSSRGPGGFGLSYKEGDLILAGNKADGSTITVTTVSGGTPGLLSITETDVQNAPTYGIRLQGATGFNKLLLARNAIRYTGSSAGTHPAISLAQSADVVHVKDNTAYDDRGTKYQTWGFQTSGAISIRRLVAEGNDFIDNLTGSIDTSSATVSSGTSYVRDNP